MGFAYTLTLVVVASCEFKVVFVQRCFQATYGTGAKCTFDLQIGCCTCIKSEWGGEKKDLSWISGERFADCFTPHHSAPNGCVSGSSGIHQHNQKHEVRHPFTVSEAFCAVQRQCQDNNRQGFL